MDHILYWLWLTMREGITREQMVELLTYYRRPEAIYDLEDYTELQRLSSYALASLKDKSLDSAKQVFERTYRIGGRIIPLDSPAYPYLLKHSSCPPFVLYCRGSILKNLNSALHIGLVGTRRCSEYGRRVAEEFTAGLAQSGVRIVSGLARGIDGVAAKTALEAGGETIGVLGCGLDIAYPPEHAQLMLRVEEQGAVITEYPPGTPPNGRHFPQRNRIIAGLCRGVIVVEAPYKSGALITARIACDESREVFVVPGSIYDESFEGSNDLLKEFGRAVTDFRDVAKEYGIPYPPKPLRRTKPSVKKQEHRENKQELVQTEEKLQTGNKKTESVQTTSVKNEPIPGEEQFSETERKILHILVLGNTHIDQLVRMLGLPLAEVNASLVLLELEGMIRREAGDRYSIMK